MALQQVPEVEDRGFVGHRLAAEIDADEPAHRQRVIERLFRSGVGQVEPMLQEVQPQHPFQANRWPAVLTIWIERFNDGRHGTTWSISARNFARRVCLLCLSKLALARVSCRISASSVIAAAPL